MLAAALEESTGQTCDLLEQWRPTVLEARRNFEEKTKEEGLSASMLSIAIIS
jgi:hypothetical protein